MVTLLCLASVQALICDEDHNHIIKDNLKIITNNRLHNLFSKRPKYRENKTADYEKAKENIITGIESCIQS